MTHAVAKGPSIKDVCKFSAILDSCLQTSEFIYYNITNVQHHDKSSIIYSICIQDTLSSRARLALRPSARAIKGILHTTIQYDQRKITFTVIITDMIDENQVHIENGTYGVISK